MDNPSTRARLWKPVSDWPAFVRPKALWPYVAEARSLTERLKAKVGAKFSVQVLEEVLQPLAAEDATLLGGRTGEAAFVRRVYLAGAAPLVYARSLGLPESGGKVLKSLGKQPLGEKAFADSATRRGRIEAAILEPSHPLYREAVAGLKTPPAGPLWARRSLLTAGGSAILIYECFLPELV